MERLGEIEWFLRESDREEIMSEMEQQTKRERRIEKQRFKEIQSEGTQRNWAKRRVRRREVKRPRKNRLEPVQRDT